MSSKSKNTVYTNSVLTKSGSSNLLPWPEWSDIELNVESWDHPKSGEYLDPQQVVMPRSLQPIEWKRFGELQYITSPVLYETISNYPDFITNNVHLLQSEFIRCFISTLINIQYCGRNGLEIENPGDNFSWNMGDQCWQGWFNVYSMNKAGKGVPHRPAINPKGKYVVRIFYMGCWRRILIDDSIPVDKKGRPLLPRTANSNELWPMILAKAMLKVASLSWTTIHEMVDCSLITCLTGWISLSLNVSHLSPRDQWEFLIKYAKHFEWPKDENTEIEQAKSNLSEKIGKSRKSKTKMTKIQVPEEPQPTLLFLSLEDTRDVDDEAIPGITPCWSHEIYVELSRDVPLDPAQMKPPLAKWKCHRWIDWAIRRDLADASEFFVPIRRLLIVSPLRQYSGNISYDDTEEFGEEDSSDTSSASREKNNGKSTTKSVLSKGKVEDNEIPDISLWGDFNKMSYYLRQVHLFYRQKFFKYSIEMSDSAKSSFPNDGKKRKVDNSTKDGKNSATKTSRLSETLDKTYEYQDKIWQSRNEPLYLFVDSIDDKFFLINFSAITRDTFADSSSKKCSSLIVERHSWFAKSMTNETVMRIQTRGTKSMVLQLEAGRHLLRIFINTKLSYRAIILSDTFFQIGNRLKMHDLMITEADRIKKLSRNISDSMKKAFEAFGTENYVTDLKCFYQSYMPDSSTLNRSNRRIIKSIHSWFLDEFWKLIENKFSSMDLPILRRAMRIFFIDPTIGMKLPIVDSSDNAENEDSWENDKDKFWESNRQVTIIQSFFRTRRIKLYRKIHDPSHEEHKRVKYGLLRIIEIFDYERNEYGANSLLREIVKHDESLEILYPWSSDLKHVIEIQELVGRVTSVTTDQWMPITRIMVNPQKDKIVFASVDLFANLSNYTVRVFDNDTNREISRVINNVTPNRYRNRNNGYTILAYGWNDFQVFNDLEWSLHLTTIKGEPKFHWINEAQSMPGKIEIRPMLIQEIADNYVPNSRNCILKVIAKVRKRSLVSLRLITSYERVLTELRVVKENGPTLTEIQAGGMVIMPFVVLEIDDTNESPSKVDEKGSRPRKSYRKSGGSLSNRSGNISRKDLIEREYFDKSTRYTIEAYVREDSWPLTLAEWKVMAEVKNQSYDKNARGRKSSTSGRKSERSRLSSRKSLGPDRESAEPYWRLQIMTDFDNELEIIRDTSKEDKIADLKRMWKIDETERSARGHKLRESFLVENSLIIAPSAIDMTNVSIRNSDEIEGTIENVNLPMNEIMTKRTLEPPANLANYLPKLDLTIYMEKEDEEEDRWVKTDYDEETLSNQRAMNVLDFEQLQLNFLEESESLMEKSREKYRRATQRCLENRESRARDINEAYQVRQIFIESTKDTARSVKSKDSIKKKKGR